MTAHLHTSASPPHTCDLHMQRPIWMGRQGIFACADLFCVALGRYGRKIRGTQPTENPFLGFRDRVRSRHLKARQSTPLHLQPLPLVSSCFLPHFLAPQEEDWLNFTPPGSDPSHHYISTL